MSLTDVARSTVGYLDIHKGGSLAFGGCVAFVGATACGIAVTPTAAKLVRTHKAKEDKKRGDTAKLVGKVAALYLPAIGLTVGGCVLVNKSCQTYRAQIATATASAAAAMEAYRLTKKELEDYREQVKEEVGEKKEKKIHDDMVEKEANANPPTGPAPNDGKIWCKIVKTGEWFQATPEDVHKTEKYLADRFSFLGCEAWVSFNDMRSELDIPLVPCGEYFGWDCEHGIDWEYSWGMLDNGDKFLAIDFDYQVDPKICNSSDVKFSDMADM